MTTQTELKALMAQLEEMWGHQAALFKIVNESGQWNHKHGQDWTFADVPYHLAYCNRDLVYTPAKFGRDLPVDQRVTISTMADLGEWNEREFAARPPGQTPEETMAQLRASWDEIRQLVSEWTDADLERPWWMPFMGGVWLTAGDGLRWTLGHDWSEFMQLRIHMGRSEPVPSPAITTHFLGAVIGGVYPQMLDPEAAQGREFRAVMAFTDPGVSSFTIEVSGGAARAVPGQVENPDLVITQSAESFEKTRSGIWPLADAIEQGEVQVSDMESLAIMGELFPM
jgi:hypothetical protein